MPPLQIRSPNGSLQTANRCLVDVRSLRACGLPIMPEYQSVLTRRRWRKWVFSRASCEISPARHSNNSLNALNTVGSAIEQRAGELQGPKARDVVTALPVTHDLKSPVTLSLLVDVVMRAEALAAKEDTRAKRDAA